MGINDTWKIKYEGKQTETFRFLMRLLTYPQWFNFSASHDECESRFEGLNWYSAEYELTEILSNLEPRDKITANVWHDLGKTTIVLTKGEDGSIEIKHNDKTGMKDSFKSKGFKILNSFDKPKDSYTYNMYDFLDRAAGLVDENEDFLELAIKYLNKFVKFTPPIKTMDDIKKLLKSRNYNSKLLNEEEKFYDYHHVYSLYPTILDMPLTILDRLGGILEFNKEFSERKNDKDFTDAVGKISVGIPGEYGTHEELTTRIRNAQDNYADLPAWVKNLPLKVLYEMGGPHKLFRYVEKYGKVKLLDELKYGDILWYGYHHFIESADVRANDLNQLIPPDTVIFSKLNDVLKKIYPDQYFEEIPQEEIDDLRVINGEYVASCIGRNNRNYITLYRESGKTEMYFKPTTISAENILSYDDHSVLPNGTRKRIWIDNYPDSKKYGMLEEKDGIINGIEAFSSYKKAIFTHELDNNNFQPSDCDLKVYSKSTGLPLIENNLFLIDAYKSPDEIERDMFSRIPRNEDTCAYLSIHKRLKVNEKSPNTVQQEVVCLYVTREDFLSGHKPVIIVFENNNNKSNNGVYRLLADGSYIDNSTYIEENGVGTFKTVSFKELIAKSNNVLQPVNRTIMNAANSNFQGIIPQEYIYLCEELLAPSKSVDKDRNGTITPEEALQSSLDGLTLDEKKNVGKKIKTKGEPTYDEQ